jgi:hypothetical protein
MLCAEQKTVLPGLGDVGDRLFGTYEPKNAKTAAVGDSTPLVLPLKKDGAAAGAGAGAGAGSSAAKETPTRSTRGTKRGRD